MKQVFLFTKTIVCVLLLHVAFSPEASAQKWPPTILNWEGSAPMALSNGVNICVVPWQYPGTENDFYYIHVVSRIFLADNLETYPDLFLYYSLPNGESDIAAITSSQQILISPSQRQEWGVPPEAIYYVEILHEICFTECDQYVRCGELSTQLVVETTNPDGYWPYPMEEYPGLFPPSVFEFDENGLAYFYTEYKEICCLEVIPEPNEQMDPCNNGNLVNHTENGLVVAVSYPTIYSGRPYYRVNGSPCEYWEPLIGNPTNEIATSQTSQLAGKHEINETSIYPNPSKSDVMVHYSGNQTGGVKFEWVDVQGRIVESVNLDDYQKGIHLESFDVSTWQSGIYFLRVSSPEGSEIIQFVKPAF